MLDAKDDRDETTVSPILLHGAPKLGSGEQDSVVTRPTPAGHPPGLLHQIALGFGKARLDNRPAVIAPSSIDPTPDDRRSHSLGLRDEQGASGSEVPYLPDRLALAYHSHDHGRIISAATSFFEIEDRSTHPCVLREEPVGTHSRSPGLSRR